MIQSLAQDADLCVIECSNLPEQEGSFHLTPKGAGECTHVAGVKQVVLVHFSAHLYTTKKMREELVRSSIHDSDIIIGQDDMIIIL
jgi:ribonuclease BN (tRNA processing enzyme)